MAKLTITSVQNYDKKKDGGALTDKKGKPYFRSVIKTNEYGDKFLTGFVYSPLAVGQVVEAKIETEMYNNQPQYRFAILSNTERVTPETQAVGGMLEELKTHTALIREILQVAERCYGILKTAEDIQAIKAPSGTPTAPMEASTVSGEEDFGNADTRDTDYSDVFPIAEEDLPGF